MSSSSQQSTSESTTSLDYTNTPITTEAVTAIINDALRTNDSLTVCLSQPHLVALSDQTKIRELGSQNMEISNPHTEADHVKIKEEDKDDSENAPMPKRVDSLPPTKSTKLP